MRQIPLVSRLMVVLALRLAMVCAQADDNFPTDFAAADVNIGERLFLETRFSEYFFTNSMGDANAVPPGDPVVATLQTLTGPVPGPFAGQAMNCRQCHLVDEEGYGPYGNHTLGNRTYADFTRRSPIPARNDGRTETTRNAPTLVDALLPRGTPLFLHHDGQFASAHDLIIGTLTGRNYGWQPEEYATAVHHIASIIRNDDGTGYLATEARGGRFRLEDTYLASYANIFAGFNNYQGSYVADPRSLGSFLISPQYQLDMRYQNASDDQILETIASLIEAYLRNLVFSQDPAGVDFSGNGTPLFNGSPFDVFLIKNHLPRLPAASETPVQYAHRLLQLVNQLGSPRFVTDPADGEFLTQTQSFQFGPLELAGMKIFLADKTTWAPDRINVGNCATCHALPAFTDFAFHNTGAAQEEYDAIHGPGAFSTLAVPGLSARQADYNAWLPPTPAHPNATGRFESPPTKANPGLADLGMWNVYANPDFPAPQAGFAQILPQILHLPVPQFTGTRPGKHRLVFNGGNGTPFGNYYVLSTSLLATNQWNVIATNQFDRLGNFSFQVLPAPGSAPAFYKLSLRLPPPAEILAHTLATFKTPTLRDLDQSGPYLHTGRMDSLEQVLAFYQQSSRLARLGQLRNADPELLNVHLENSAIIPLAAFLRSLDEDYTD